jgi:GntR family transcriptional regulator
LTAEVTNLGRTTRYYEVATVLREEIRTGVFPVGDMFLTEVEICARFGVSRFTAREALRRLEDAGLVERRQGSGTRVVAKDAEVRYVFTTSSEADVLRYARDTVLVGRGEWRPAPARRRAALQLDPEREWLVLDATRRARSRGPAIGVTTVYVDAALAPDDAHLDLPDSRPIFVQLAEARGLQLLTIEQEIYATTLPAATAKRLGVETGSPGLGVIRRFAAADIGLYEVSETLHPADQFRYSLKLTNDSLG